MKKTHRLLHFHLFLLLSINPLTIHAILPVPAYFILDDAQKARKEKEKEAQKNNPDPTKKNYTYTIFIPFHTYASLLYSAIVPPVSSLIHYFKKNISYFSTIIFTYSEYISFRLSLIKKGSFSDPCK